MCTTATSSAAESMEQLHHPEHEADRRRRLANPEDKHPLGERDLELRELPVHTRKADLHLRPQLGGELIDLCFELDNTLLEFGVEPRVVHLVQLAQLRPVRRINHVEPIHELVGDVVTKLLVKPARQLRCNRHTSSTGRCRYTIRYARRTPVSIKLHSGAVRLPSRPRPQRSLRDCDTIR